VCPLHAFRFDGRTGACDQAGTCPVPTYPVEVANGVVRIALDVV
jgi:nitrite reductase (NADH) small subunit